MSFGCYEESLSPSVLEAFNIEAIKLALQGVTLVVSSGDDGVGGFWVRYSSAFCGYGPMFPASSPYVTSVGGTMGLEVGAEEWASSLRTGAPVTTGGGFSIMYDAPEWQQRHIKQYFAGLSNDKKPYMGYRASGRGYPDVSLASVDFPIISGGRIFLVSGTSASCPVVAAMISLINSELLENGKPPVGFINPLLYESDGSFANDVVIGDNHCSTTRCCKHGFYSSRGWDPVTGFGSVDFIKLRGILIDGHIPKVHKSWNVDIDQTIEMTQRKTVSSSQLIIIIFYIFVSLLLITLIVRNIRRMCNYFVQARHSAEFSPLTSETTRFRYDNEEKDVIF